MTIFESIVEETPDAASPDSASIANPPDPTTSDETADSPGKLGLWVTMGLVGKCMRKRNSVRCRNVAEVETIVTEDGEFRDDIKQKIEEAKVQTVEDLGESTTELAKPPGAMVPRSEPPDRDTVLKPSPPEQPRQARASSPAAAGPGASSSAREQISACTGNLIPVQAEILSSRTDPGSLPCIPRMWADRRPEPRSFPEAERTVQRLPVLPASARERQSGRASERQSGRASERQSVAVTPVNFFVARHERLQPGFHPSQQVILTFQPQGASVASVSPRRKIQGETVITVYNSISEGTEAQRRLE
jgi:hypothetical protein